MKIILVPFALLFLATCLLLATVIAVGERIKSMKTIAIIFAIVVLSLSGMAQTNQTTLDKIIGMIGSPTNYAVEPYMTYAPSAPTKIGGGVLGVYNVNNYVGLGLGVDWLGSFSLVSGDVTLQAPFRPLPNQFPTFELSPFAIAGIGTAYSGNGNFNGAASVIEDAGFYSKFGHAFGGQFNAGITYGQWTGAGPYDVKRYHIFFGWSHGF